MKHSSVFVPHERSQTRTAALNTRAHAFDSYLKWVTRQEAGSSGTNFERLWERNRCTRSLSAGAIRSTRSEPRPAAYCRDWTGPNSYHRFGVVFSILNLGAVISDCRSLSFATISVARMVVALACTHSTGLVYVSNRVRFIFSAPERSVARGRLMLPLATYACSTISAATLALWPFSSA